MPKPGNPWGHLRHSGRLKIITRDAHGYTCRAEFEFRLSRQEVARHANSDCGLRQPSLPKLMGTAEFDIKLKINKMSACGATRVVLNDIIIYHYIIQWFDYVLLSNEALRGRVMMCKVLKILLTKVARNHVTWWQKKGSHVTLSAADIRNFGATYVCGDGFLVGIL